MVTGGGSPVAFSAMSPMILYGGMGGVDGNEVAGPYKALTPPMLKSSSVASLITAGRLTMGYHTLTKSTMWEVGVYVAANIVTPRLPLPHVGFNWPFTFGS